MRPNPAKLRICASCEWIFKSGLECPMCNWGSYGARATYGNDCYKYARTQQPWFDAKIADYSVRLHEAIQRNTAPEIKLRTLLGGVKMVKAKRPLIESIKKDIPYEKRVVKNEHRCRHDGNSTA